MTAHLDKNERQILRGQKVKVEGIVERVDRYDVVIRISPGLVACVPLAAVEVIDDAR